jgi:hypothetical protein
LQDIFKFDLDIHLTSFCPYFRPLAKKDLVDATPHPWIGVWLTALGFKVIRG